MKFQFKLKACSDPVAVASLDTGPPWGSTKSRSKHPFQYQSILQAIQNLLVSQSNHMLSFRLSRDQAAEISTKVIHENHKHILESILIYQALQETHQISADDTLWFLIGDMLFRQQAQGIREEVSAVQEKLDQEDEESTGAQQLLIKRKVCNLVCKECKEVFSDFCEFGCHVVEHIQAKKIDRCRKCRRPVNFHGHTKCIPVDHREHGTGPH